MIANTFFSQNLKEGNIGEAIAAEFLTSVGFSVDDVSSNPDYFYKDIDLIATIDEETITVEVKADAKVSSTGNVCIEVIGNKAKNKKGWIYYCQATHIFFVDVKNRICYCVRREELLNLYRKKANYFRHITRQQLEDGVYYKEAELGDYEINPLITSQVLPTYDKHMIDDLTINMIPTREIDNASGGTTFIIGG